MKKKQILMLIITSIIFFSGISNALAKVNDISEKATTETKSNINLDLNNIKKHEIQISQPPEKIEGQIFQSDEDKIMSAFQAQKQMDVEDIRVLWESTVERNSVIKFALKKIATPAEQRRVHSSLMAKSVSALISGASILPGIFGADTITSSAASVSGSLANRVIATKALPKNIPITDTELIQLAKLVEELQDRLIKNYYDYKSSIEALRVCRQNLILHNKNYSDALKSGNEISMISSSALYDKDLYNELSLEQQIKSYRLDLERLAGPEAVSKLNLIKLVSYNTDKMNTTVNTKQNQTDKKEVK